jgi:hypothetical protein
MLHRTRLRACAKEDPALLASMIQALYAIVLMVRERMGSSSAGVEIDRVGARLPPTRPSTVRSGEPHRRPRPPPNHKHNPQPSSSHAQRPHSSSSYKQLSRPSSAHRSSRPPSGHERRPRSSSHDQGPQSSLGYKQPSRHPSAHISSRSSPGREQPSPPSRYAPNVSGVPCAIPEEPRRRRHEFKRKVSPDANRRNGNRRPGPHHRGIAWHEMFNTDGAPSPKTIEWEWEIPSALELSRDSRHPDISDTEWLENLLILVGTVGVDEKLRNLEATTCGRYLEEHWGPLTAGLLQDIAECLENVVGTDPATCM